ncbi:ATP-dependent RNA helicase dbp6, partial [Rhizoclosmatium hyalinum]
MFKVERYGDESKPRPPPPVPSTAPTRTAVRATAAPTAPLTSTGKVDWRALKTKKKRWAVDLERQLDEQRGDKPNATDAQAAEFEDESPKRRRRDTVDDKPKRSRGGVKNKAKLDRKTRDPLLEESISNAEIHEDAVALEDKEDVDDEVVPQEEEEQEQTEEPVDPNAYLFADASPAKKLHSNLKSQGLPQWLANPTRIPSTLSTKTPESSTANPAYNLSKHTQARLAALDIHHLFPVQQAVIPKLLLSRYSSSPRTPPGDLLVSSATGSGKTLAYVLPILEYLISTSASSAATTARVIPRLRALIVVPTRDLAVQVKTTLEQVSKGSSIRIGVVTGSMSFHAEQEMLVETGGRDVGTEGIMNDGRCCKVDVLVATPGRLTDHLKGTPGFSLRHLRFLVLDEADRLLVQDYQGWLNMVLKGVKEDLIDGDGISLADEEGGITAHSKSRYDRYLA